MNRLTDISHIKSLLSRHGFNFSKTLGQNFLINPAVCPKMIEAGGITPETNVIEIGAGIGTLTYELSRRAKKVVSIEIDKKLMPVLDETLSDCGNVKIISGDVLKLDLPRIIAQEFDGEVAVCANLPYYITSPVIMALLEQRLPLKSITVMVQKEAAVRITAAPGTKEAGAISYAVNYYGHPKLMFNISPGSFMPAPKVNSAVIRLIPRSGESAYTDVNDQRLLFSLIKAGFATRRKQLVNCLPSLLGMTKTEFSDLLSALGLNPNCRAEELSLEDFIRIANHNKGMI
ncbi:MAG: 16S rRNA (adenine(1518)-N(6)/adenine(1519)-N(6))-dimethyltransferase RsmA [Oscillospiraceae bacterium]|nr:16S rRNA (adenine(1518)-N(6)/adenine(1519)-N(6))-dimethyltransferase RsmA [Oscillospiraceae bacterium]